MRAVIADAPSAGIAAATTDGRRVAARPTARAGAAAGSRGVRPAPEARR
jgi:hypothetical protein